MTVPFQVPLMTVPSADVPVTARAEVVAFVDVELTVVRFVMVFVAEFTEREPETERAVVEAKVRVAFVPARVPVLRFVIVEEAAFTIMPPEKYERPVVVAPTAWMYEGLNDVAVRVPTFRFVMVEEAALTMRPPEKYESKVFVELAKV